MKRCWVGAVFLLVLLVGSLAVSRAMEAIHAPVEKDLDRAAESALAGDWKSAGEQYRRARAQWEKWDRFRACFADHTPMEEITAGLHGLEAYWAEQEEGDFAAQCRSLAKKAAAVGEAHGLRWRNIF